LAVIVCTATGFCGGFWHGCFICFVDSFIDLGSTMNIVIRNPLWLKRELYAFAVPEYLEYSGEETTLRHVSSDSLCLTTGLPEFPVRVIPRAWIVSGVSVGAAAVADQGSTGSSYTVTGSRGSEYTVTHSSGVWHCSCAGFEFRHSCRHITELAKTH
jgi:hypothetical protein